MLRNSNQGVDQLTTDDKILKLLQTLLEDTDIGYSYEDGVNSISFVQGSSYYYLNQAINKLEPVLGQKPIITSTKKGLTLTFSSDSEALLKVLAKDQIKLSTEQTDASAATNEIKLEDSFQMLKLNVDQDQQSTRIDFPSSLKFLLLSEDNKDIKYRALKTEYYKEKYERSLQKLSKLTSGK